MLLTIHFAAYKRPEAFWMTDYSRDDTINTDHSSSFLWLHTLLSYHQLKGLKITQNLENLPSTANSISEFTSAHSRAQHVQTDYKELSTYYSINSKAISLEHKAIAMCYLSTSKNSWFCLLLQHVTKSRTVRHCFSYIMNFSKCSAKGNEHPGTSSYCHPYKHGHSKQTHKHVWRQPQDGNQDISL